MRAPRTASQASGNTELQLAPLIDCVFLLLTYFLFTISLSTIEGLLPSEIAMGNDPQQRQPDIGLATAKLGWRPTVPLDEGLRRTIAYFKGML